MLQRRAQTRGLPACRAKSPEPSRRSARLEVGDSRRLRGRTIRDQLPASFSDATFTATLTTTRSLNVSQFASAGGRPKPSDGGGTIMLKVFDVNEPVTSTSLPA